MRDRGEASGGRSRLGVTRATINSDKFESLVRTEQLGTRGDAYILNAEGIFQTPPRNESVLAKSRIGVPRTHRA